MKNKNTWIIRKLGNHWYEIGFQSGCVFLPRYRVKWKAVDDEVLKLLQGRKSRIRMKFFILSLNPRSEIQEV